MVQEQPQHRDPKSKTDHIRVCQSPDVEYVKTTGLERFDFINQAVPNTSLQHLDLTTTLVDQQISLPIMIAPMTGGTESAAVINAELARCAERHNIPMAVGSQRVAVEQDALRAHFDIRRYAKRVPVFANFGAAQLVKGWGEREARTAIDMIEASALFVHFNPVQEAIQGGDQDFRNIAEPLTSLCSALARDGIPVFAREVCFGISEDAARQLIDCGVAGIDCAGAGGTSWAKVEGLCAKTDRRRKLGQQFGEWGIPTAESIQNVRRVDSDIPLVATGGIRDGIDVAKAIALGANVAAMARPFLLRAIEGSDALDAFVESITEELQVCMFGAGAQSVTALRQSTALVERSR